MDIPINTASRMDDDASWYEKFSGGEIDVFGDGPPEKPPARRRIKPQFVPQKSVTYGPTHQQLLARSYTDKRILEKCSEYQLHIPDEMDVPDRVVPRYSRSVEPAAKDSSGKSAHSQALHVNTPRQDSVFGGRRHDGLYSSEEEYEKPVGKPHSSLVAPTTRAIAVGRPLPESSEVVKKIPDGDTSEDAQVQVATHPKRIVQGTPSIFRPTLLVKLDGALPIPFGDKRFTGDTNKIKWTGSKQAYYRKCSLFILGHSTKCGLKLSDVKIVFEHIFPKYVHSLSEPPSPQKFGSQLSMHTCTEKPRHSDWDELLGLLPVVGWKQKCVNDCERAVQLALSQLGMQANAPSPCASCIAWTEDVARKKRQGRVKP